MPGELLKAQSLAEVGAGEHAWGAGATRKVAQSGTKQAQAIARQCALAKLIHQAERPAPLKSVVASVLWRTSAGVSLR